ncbi:hypothetical protein FUAX_53240 (plasmid) [Fulvitalea axinellae]|uniref:Uncharacterized protein n=1 Tax=Fulvitalea axinellae TaxID=1182444 RepID=A0AAU9D692_9BACT|nr:hypothetical protein FUAX_53240 [Fulvitalea axinellae]
MTKRIRFLFLFILLAGQVMAQKNGIHLFARAETSVSNGKHKANLVWATVPEAIGYTVRYGYSSSLAKSQASDGNVTKALLDNLKEDSPLYWRVRAHFADGTYKESETTRTRTCRIIRQDGSRSPEDYGYAPLTGRQPVQIKGADREALGLEYKEKSDNPGILYINIQEAGSAEILTRLAMIKKPGVNRYLVNLTECQHKWESDKLYRISIDGLARTALLFSLSDIEEIQPEISTEVLELYCETPQASLLRFTGTVKGGKPPYKVSWRVAETLNAEIESIPLKASEILEAPDQSSVLQANRPVGYYVILTAKDYCGREGMKVVYVDCDGEKPADSRIEFYLLEQNEKGKTGRGKKEFP